MSEVYADGAAEPNPGPGAYAAIIVDGRGEHELVGYEKHTTNNRMELMAAIVALEHLERGRVRVTSDSQYVVQGATRWRFAWKRRGWRRRDGGHVLNLDLWQRLDAAIQKHAAVEWVWQRGHAGHHTTNAVTRWRSQRAARAGWRPIYARIALNAGQRGEQVPMNPEPWPIAVSVS
jgi:ribonuclease HI